MDPVDSKFETIERRRRSRRLFRHSKIPVRMLVPNFFTLVVAMRGRYCDPHGDRAAL